jgi:hypothetical protein
MILSNKEVLNLLRIGLEDETDLSVFVLTETEEKPRESELRPVAAGNSATGFARESNGADASKTERDFRGAQFISDIANTEPRPVSTSLAVAKRVEAAKGLARDGYKPLMRNRTGEKALPDRHTASDTFSPIPSDLGLLLLAALPE